LRNYAGYNVIILAVFDVSAVLAFGFDICGLKNNYRNIYRLRETKQLGSERKVWVLYK